MTKSIAGCTNMTTKSVSCNAIGCPHYYHEKCGHPENVSDGFRGRFNDTCIEGLRLTIQSFRKERGE
jgi:hypothetical protein